MYLIQTMREHRRGGDADKVAHGQSADIQG